MSDANVYSQPVTLKCVLKFAVPTIIMTVFMSFYTMVDGLFVANLIGTDALSAVNLTAPVISAVTAVSTMLAAGGSAVIMKKAGEKKMQEANEDFTCLILVNAAVGLVMSCFGYLVMDSMFASMNLSLQVSEYCHVYLSRYLIFTTPILLMNNFTLYMIAAGKAALSMICSIAGGVLNIALDYILIAVCDMGIGGLLMNNFTLYMIAAGKAALSMICSIAGGVLNIALDYILIAVCDMGIGGAAVATGLGYSVTAAAGILLFSKKSSLLHFVKPVYKKKTLWDAAVNGSSEMASALMTGIITMMFNWTMLKYAGENGVAAITIIMYVLMFATSLYTGYSYGVAPMISFFYGEQNHAKLKKLIRLSLKLIGITAAAALVLSLIAAKPLVLVFARPDNPVYDLAVTGNRICSAALIFIGFNVFISGMFTALSNGLISAVLAFSRSFVFMVIAMLILPALFGVTGAWLAVPAAEFTAIILSFILFIRYRKKYSY